MKSNRAIKIHNFNWKLIIIIFNLVIVPALFILVVAFISLVRQFYINMWFFLTPSLVIILGIIAVLCLQYFQYRNGVLNPHKIKELDDHQEEQINLLSSRITEEQSKKTHELFFELIKSINNPVVVLNDELEIFEKNNSFSDLSLKSTNSILKNKKVMSVIKKVKALEKTILNNTVEFDGQVYLLNCLFLTSKERMFITLFFEDITNQHKMLMRENEFVSNISHELKTPVSAILLAIESIELLKKNDLPKEDFRIIKKQATNMKNMINNFLAYYSSTKQDNLFLDKKDESVNEIIDNVLDDLSFEIKLKKVEIITNIEKCFISCDKLKIKSVLINALKNAIFYSNNKPKIIITGYLHEGFYVIEITDNGVGMTESEIAKVFDKFYRIQQDRSRDSGGHGIGLSIIKSFVKLHNGNVNIESKPNVGTKVIIKLPC